MTVAVGKNHVVYITGYGLVLHLAYLALLPFLTGQYMHFAPRYSRLFTISLRFGEILLIIYADILCEVHRRMQTFLAGQFDIAVIGAGHAGIEAALAAARLGLETVIFTINLDAVGNMPCNPAIGGTGKGHLVRELDALGGEMAKAADRACIQYRMLNRGKGPAVWSLRAQADRREYQKVMKHTLEKQDHLTVRQGEVTELRAENGCVSEVVLRTGAVYRVKAAVIATGTYLHGRTIIGECIEESGPDGMHAATELTASLLELGLPLRRFKTGTPPRVNARTVDFSKM